MLVHHFLICKFPNISIYASIKSILWSVFMFCSDESWNKAFDVVAVDDLIRWLRTELYEPDSVTTKVYFLGHSQQFTTVFSACAYRSVGNTFSFPFYNTMTITSQFIHTTDSVIAWPGAETSGFQILRKKISEAVNEEILTSILHRLLCPRGLHSVPVAVNRNHKLYFQL